MPIATKEPTAENDSAWPIPSSSLWKSRSSCSSPNNSTVYTLTFTNLIIRWPIIMKVTTIFTWLYASTWHTTTLPCCLHNELRSYSSIHPSFNPGNNWINKYNKEKASDWLNNPMLLTVIEILQEWFDCINKRERRTYFISNRKHSIRFLLLLDRCAFYLSIAISVKG